MSEPFYDSQPQNSTMSIVSLVAGILGLSFMPGIASIVAIITASMAEKEIRESGGRLEGENFARIGKILGWVGIAFAVIGVCCAVVFFIVFPLFAISASSSSSIIPLIPFLGM